MSEQIYTNYRLLLPDQEVLGTLIVKDGVIADIQPDRSNQGQDGYQDYLLPGIIELHTDNLEKCISPRPGVKWPLPAAVSNHDRQLISAGITTVYDAIAIGDIQAGSLRLSHSQTMIESITSAQLAGRLTADHRLHLRCELSYEHVTQVLDQHVDNPLLSMISLMDHTPGQRQFIHMDKFREYYMGKHGLTADQVEHFIQERLTEQRLYADSNRQSLVKLAQAKGIPIASHDDATVDHVQEALDNGATIAEFPTTLEAAQAAHCQGLNVLMGAPNVVLGGSHSGNVAALELAQQEVLDILSSDYAPQSLLHAVFIIAQQLDQPLYRVAKVITQNPAQVVQCSHDRGSLDVGKRADFITVQDDGRVPKVSSVYVQGQRVG